MTVTWNWVASLLRRVALRTHRATLDEELREEMQFHLEMLARDNEARGMSRESALEAARRQFGSATLQREASRRHWSLGWMDATCQDVGYSVRSLMRTPGVTITALLTLTLGIGATATVVALLDATLLHPIALRDVDRIVTIRQVAPGKSDFQQLAPGNYISIRNAPTVFKSVALARNWDVTVSGRTTATAADGLVVTPNYFSVLGVTPRLGRVFTQADAEASASRPTAVILSYGLWLRHFNRDPSIIGRGVVLNGIPRAVVGVLGEHDGFPPEIAVWGPLQLPANAASDRASVNSFVFARLRPGATARDAAHDVAAIQRRLVRESPATNAGWIFTVAPLKEYHTEDYRAGVLFIVGAVAAVLLIACTNVANLLLVRAVARQREMAVRAALGAGRAQLARQLVIEGLLLSLTAGAFGMALGELGVRLLKQNIPADFASFLPGWRAMGVNWYVLSLILGVCIAIGVGFSAVPALRAARTDLTGALKQGARGSMGSRRIARVRSVFVINQIVLAVILLAVAGLLAQSFTRLDAARTGLRPDHVLTMNLVLPGTFDATRAVTYHHAVLHRLETLPGVRGAALIDMLPLSNSNNYNPFIPDSRPTLQLMQAPNARDERVTLGYFAVMGIPVIRGRSFNDTDLDTAASVVIVNRALADRYWPGGGAIGHTVRMGTRDRDRYTIVGVVGNVLYSGANEAPHPEVYHPTQGRLWTTDVVIQTDGDPAEMEQEVMSAVGKIDPSVAITRVMTMRAMMARHYSYNRILADALGIFAFIALVIAAAGIYGVVSYGVAQRTQEIGVRMALGAKSHAVVRMVLIEGARVAVIGLTLGIIGAWFAGKALAFLLYGVAPGDPVTLIAVAMILGVVAIAASYFPARRAGRVEPVVALRYE